MLAVTWLFSNKSSLAMCMEQRVHEMAAPVDFATLSENVLCDVFPVSSALLLKLMYRALPVFPMKVLSERVKCDSLVAS